MAGRARRPKAKRSKKTVIQVPIDYDLLASIDAAAGRVAESRAAFIRDACALRLRALAEEAGDRQYEAAYRAQPEDVAWAKMGARILASRLAKDRW
jgi:hypothetical protein